MFEVNVIGFLDIFFNNAHVSSKSGLTSSYDNSIIFQVYCYDLKLGLSCNLGKDLSKSEGNGQLVKCKDTELYLHYIYL